MAKDVTRARDVITEKGIVQQRKKYSSVTGREQLRRDAVITSGLGGHVVKRGGKRITLYRMQKGRPVYAKRWIPRSRYNGYLKRARGRVDESQQYRNRELPEGFRKPLMKGSVLVWMPNRKRGSAAEKRKMLGELKASGIQVKERGEKRNKDVVIKGYTTTQKEFIYQTLARFKDWGKPKETP